MFSRLLRFRSLERSRDTDERRIALIQRVVRSAIADAEAELTGLRARIAKTRRLATFLLDNLDSEPDGSHRVKLRNLEQNLHTAEQRLLQLKDHLEFLRSIEVSATRLPP